MGLVYRINHYLSSILQAHDAVTWRWVEFIRQSVLFTWRSEFWFSDLLEIEYNHSCRAVVILV
jgi:hypothetical protein